MKEVGFNAMISTDWNECLAPSGPFDPISFAYPHLSQELESIFRLYTGNKMTLGQAVERIKGLLPKPFKKEQMDAYLKSNFTTYKGVPEFIEWCASNDILFMINTTASIGFFQRVFALGLLPRVHALSAHDMLVYDPLPSDPPIILPLRETSDKATNTKRVSEEMGIPPERIFIIGDSGGDGPHFKWGKAQGCFLIGSMTKASLQEFCSTHGVVIDAYFGVRYEKGEGRDLKKEMEYDFMELRSILNERL